MDDNSTLILLLYMASHVTQVSYLNLKGVLFSSQLFFSLLETIQCHPLAELYLSNNTIDSYGQQALFSLLKSMPGLRVLGLNNCGIDSEGIVCLASELEYNSITNLQLNDNPIGDDGLMALGMVLE